MNELKIFNNNEFGEIRVLEKDGAPWFVATDICKSLELSNATVAVNGLDEDERSKFNLGRQGESNIVNEYGLYNLILSSRKKSAKEFKRWITHEVIPSIRKHGAYMTENALEEALTSPDFLIKLATQLKEEKESNKKLVVENKIKDQQIAELKPSADYTDRILKNNGLVTISQIAKDYGMAGRSMNEKLHQLKVQYKQSGQWLLYAKYQNKGYTHSETIDLPLEDGSTKIVMNTKWTQKGRLFLYEKLRENGIYPRIEQN
ncbi:MAG: phage antirepressor [Peptostreptococcus sp.]|uniref:phage antirepressor n=1 Tax=Peptostreptococcus sp. TaxID=1262 RepID=UPI002FC84E03